MPKRSYRLYLDTPKNLLRRLPKYNRFPTVKTNDDEISNDDKEDGGNGNFNEILDARLYPRKKPMRRMRYNQNNEIERLLLHNSSNLYYHIDHSDFPSFNVGIWPQNTRNVYPSSAFSIPRPIHVADTEYHKIDLCYKRPMARDFHRKRMATSRTAYQTAIKTKKSLRLGERKNQYHAAVFDIAERVLTQPDPFFKGSFDYYYSGGNLCILPETGHIAHASGNNLQTVEISEFPMVEDYKVTTSLRSIAKTTLPQNCEIFEVQPMLTSSDIRGRNSFIARQRNVISLNCLSEDDEIKTITQFRTKTTPFISFCQSDRDYRKLLITTMKQHVRFYDLGGTAPRLVKLFEIEPEGRNTSWNAVKPWRENTFLYANEYKFCLIDTRTSPDQWMASVTSAIEHNFICDHISSITPSDFNNMFYVGTNHKLHCMDIRNIKSYSFNDPEAVVCRWSHQMQYAPLMLDTYRLHDSEFIALSSPIAGDLHVCELSRQKNFENLSFRTTNRIPKHIFSSSCMPYQLPTLMEAYESARLAGMCLQPDANLRNRLQVCTTGMHFSRPTFQGNKSSLGVLLTSNSLGDIYAHNMYKREGQEGDSRGNAQSNEMMAEFAKTLTEQNHPLNYTYIKNMKAMRKVFLCEHLNTNLKCDIDDMDDSFSENDNPAPPRDNPLQPEKKKRKKLHLGRWQKSFAALHSYKDALVPDLLSIWDIEMEEEKNVRLGNLQTSCNIKPDPALKVRDWLETNLNPNHPMTSIPPNESLNYVEPVTNNGGDAADISMDLDQTQMDFEAAVQSTQIVNSTVQLNVSAGDTLLNNTTISMDKSKTKKKTKKYVKGF